VEAPVVGEALTIISSDPTRITMISNTKATEEAARPTTLEATLNQIITHKETPAVASPEAMQDMRKKKQGSIEL
jgi:hypothetical protein